MINKKFRFDIYLWLFILFGLFPLYGWLFQCGYKEIFMKALLVGIVVLSNRYFNGN